MKRIIIILVMFILGFQNSKAQQMPQFTQYMYNTIAINPAYAGSREVLSIVAMGRNQWTGFNGGPQTQTLSINSPLRNEKIGLGLSLINDKAGYEDFTYVYGNFSYTINLGDKTKLAFGVDAGATSYNVSDELYNGVVTGNDPYFYEKWDRWNPNFGAGLLFHSDKWYAGFSAPRLINNDGSSESEYKSLEQIHYFLIAGYVFDLSKSVKLKPSILAKYTADAPASIDFTANFLFNEKFWLGASYRSNGQQAAFGALVDFQVTQQFRVGYTYELPTGEIRAYTSGSQEILLMYEFRFTKKNLKSPRYF